VVYKLWLIIVQCAHDIVWLVNLHNYKLNLKIECFFPISIDGTSDKHVFSSEVTESPFCFDLFTKLSGVSEGTEGTGGECLLWLNPQAQLRLQEERRMGIPL